MMSDLSFHWSAALVVIVDMGVAMLLGWVVGFERFFSGRTAGSQVYCLVCTTSAAVTLFGAQPAVWNSVGQATGSGDPTRVVSAVLTGIGFLGAGIIVQTGLNIRGLTTAASIWGSAAVGILVGAHWYVEAVGLTAFFVFAMELVPRLEQKLPARAAISASISFCQGHKPAPDVIQRYIESRGLQMPRESVAIKYANGRYELQCMIFAPSTIRSDIIGQIAHDLAALNEVETFVVSPSSRA